MTDKTKINRILIISLVLLTGIISCKDGEKRSNELEITKQYYEALDRSSGSEMKALLADSLLTVIPEYNYEQTFSRDDYVEKWLKWDSIFEPQYEVLHMELDNGIVKAKVSKSDKRIQFLMQEPFITNETVRFQNGKIITVETEYVNFDEATWERNKNRLMSWIEQNHPELNGFINDQTVTGGMKYLKAIELYEEEQSKQQ